MRAFLGIAPVIVLLAGCTAAPPSFDLPAVDEVMEVLSSTISDENLPQGIIAAPVAPHEVAMLVLGPQEPEVTGAVAVACSSEDGRDVTIDVTIDGADQGTIVAQCGEAPGATLATQQVERYDFTGEVSFTVTSPVPAVVAIGIVAD